MTIDINDGQNIISIGLDGLGSYYRVNRPVSLIWADCRGSIGQYLAMMPLSEEERLTIQKRLVEKSIDKFFRPV